jgi:hypothetical protein
MWTIDDIEIREVELDFTSSAGGRPQTTALYADNTCLVNAIGFAELNSDPAQLIVCESCGHVHCEPGGWVHLRRIGEYVGFIPAFTEMLDGEFESTEYSPPKYIAARGAPTFDSNSYAALRSAVPAFPATEQIKLITASEAVRLLQWQATFRVLGRFPNNPILKTHAVLAVSDGQLDEQCNRLQEFIDQHIDSRVALSVCGHRKFSPVEFHLDGPGFPTWRPIAVSGNDVAFNFEHIGQLTLSQSAA